jgi:hypothetical protein
MARTWRNERTTPKKPPVQAPVRPRMDEFAREYYQGKGYSVDDTVTAPQTLANNGQFDEIYFLEGRGYAEADA